MFGPASVVVLAGCSPNEGFESCVELVPKISMEPGGSWGELPVLVVVTGPPGWRVWEPAGIKDSGHDCSERACNPAPSSGVAEVFNGLPTGPFYGLHGYVRGLRKLAPRHEELLSECDVQALVDTDNQSIPCGGASSWFLEVRGSGETLLEMVDSSRGQPVALLPPRPAIG